MRRRRRWRGGLYGIGFLIAVVAGSASAQELGQVSTARTLEPGTHDAGGFLGVFEHATTVFGQYRRGLSSNSDFGVQFGLVDNDTPGSDANIILGGDLKFNVMSTETDPFDLALGVRSSFYNVDPVSVFTFGGAVVISRGYNTSYGSVLTPYGAVNVRWRRTSYGSHLHSYMNSQRLAVNHMADSESDLNIDAAVGAKWELSDLIDALGEIVLNDDLGIVLGLNFKL